MSEIIKKEEKDNNCNVHLEWITPDAQHIIAKIARVSNPANQENRVTEPKLIKYLADHKHWSPFEMASLCVEINTTRAISAQILRHRSFQFQEFCVSEGTLITCLSEKEKSKKIPIETLYEYQFDNRLKAIWERGIRVYDETLKMFIRSTIKEIFKTGEKECFKVILEDGKELECTEDHKLYNKNGFIKLKDCKIGDFIAVNGEPVYQNYEWMKQEKERCLREKVGIQTIADNAKISYHTIRKWLKKHNLIFTKKEVASCFEIWNKNLPSEQQPMFGKTMTDETREKMRQSSKKGYESNLYKGGKERSERQKIYDWQNKYKNKLLIQFNNKCNKCENTENLQIDHIEPVYANPELAYDYNNLQLLCKECHKQKSLTELIESKQTIKYKKILSIEPAGLKMTYDIEVNHDSHNYVANGIVTHNSQRYSEATTYTLPHFRLQDHKNRQNSFDTIDENKQNILQQEAKELIDKCFEMYNKCIEQGVAKESARFILPLCTNTTIYMTGTIRSWIHYIQVRASLDTQAEHREIACKVKDILLQELPILSELLQ